MSPRTKPAPRLLGFGRRAHNSGLAYQRLLRFVQERLISIKAPALCGMDDPRRTLVGSVGWRRSVVHQVQRIYCLGAPSHNTELGKWWRRRSSCSNNNILVGRILCVIPLYGSLACLFFATERHEIWISVVDTYLGICGTGFTRIGKVLICARARAQKKNPLSSSSFPFVSSVRGEH